MKFKLLLLSFIFSNFLFAQKDIDSTDKMIDQMCLDFQNSENLSDSIRIQNLNQKFILPYLDQFSDLERESKIDHIYFRLQKRCEYFREYLFKIDPPKTDDWKKLQNKPKATISDNELSKFKTHTNFYYAESGGEKTYVKTNSEYWIETFSDGTNSKLNYEWVGKNKFDLIFIESNNNSRKNFSKKGDRYHYEIISKEGDFYNIVVGISGQTQLMQFKLFAN